MAVAVVLGPISGMCQGVKQMQRSTPQRSAKQPSDGCWLGGTAFWYLASRGVGFVRRHAGASHSQVHRRRRPLPLSCSCSLVLTTPSLPETSSRERSFSKGTIQTCLPASLPHGTFYLLWLALFSLFFFSFFFLCLFYAFWFRNN